MDGTIFGVRKDSTSKHSSRFQWDLDGGQHASLVKLGREMQPKC